MTITTRRNAARQFAVGAIGTPSKTARLLAHLPLDEQAKVVRWAGDARVVNAKMTRHDVTRTPDITDEDEVVWFTEEFAVTVPIERLGAFRAYIACRGLTRCDAYTVSRLVPGDTPTWDALFAAVKA